MKFTWSCVHWLCPATCIYSRAHFFGFRLFNRRGHCVKQPYKCVCQRDFDYSVWILNVVSSCVMFGMTLVNICKVFIRIVGRKRCRRLAGIFVLNLVQTLVLVLATVLPTTAFSTRSLDAGIFAAVLVPLSL